MKISCTKVLSNENIEKAIQYCYLFSVSLSPLGPACHYSLWGVCFILLVYNCFVNNASLKLTGVSKQGWLIFSLLALLALWTVVAGLFSFEKISYYGHNVTRMIEIVFGAYLAMRTLREEDARRKFITLFIVISDLILIGNLLRLLKFIPFFPNRVLANGNSLGGLGLLLFPSMVGYAFWSVGNSVWKKVLLLVPVCAVIVLSFSSGAWISAFLGGLVLLYYAVRCRKLTFRFFALALCLFLLCMTSFDLATQGKYRRLFLNEFKQLQSVDDLNKFTTLRNQVWSATWYMIKERPILGCAGELFENKNRWLMKHKAKELGLTVKRDIDHPHSTYMYLLYIGGFPALIIFVGTMSLCVRRMCRLARHENNSFYPWAVVSLSLLVEILTYGTNGDILQGRRDISVLVWCFFGVMAMLPTPLHRRKV